MTKSFLARPFSLKSTILSRLFLDVTSRGSFFIANLLIARTLSVADFGKFTHALFLAFLFGVLSDLGFNIQMNKELGEVRGKRDDHWKPFLEIRIVSALVTLGLFSLFAHLFWVWDGLYLIYLTLFWFFGNSFFEFFQTVCNGQNRLDIARPHMLIHRGCIFAGALIPVIFFKTLPSVIVGIAAGSLIGLAASTIYILRRLKTGFSFAYDFSEWKRIAVFSIPNGLSLLLRVWYSRLGIIFLGWYVAAKFVGEFSAALRMFEIGFILSASLLSIELPHLSEAFSRAGQFRKELMKVLKITALATLSWTTFLWLLGPWCLVFLFGKNYHGAVPILKILTIATLAIMLRELTCTILIIINRQKRYTLHEGLMFLLSLTLYLTLIPQKGAHGLAWTMTIIEIALLSLNLIFFAWLLRRKLCSYLLHNLSNPIA